MVSQSTTRSQSVFRTVPGQARRQIGGVAVDVLDERSARTVVLDAAASGKPLMVAFCNAHSVNLAAENSAFRGAMAHALVLNDGLGLDLASLVLFGRKFCDNLNGTDFVPGLLSAATDPIRLFLIGARPGVAEKAGAVLASNCVAVTVVGAAHGFFNAAEEEILAQRIRESCANLILVGMGQPRQELWAQQHSGSFAGPTLCVGGLFDFLTGEVPRAPRLVRRMRLEWLFRLVNDPRRLAGRYLIGNLAFITRITSQWALAKRT